MKHNIIIDYNDFSHQTRGIIYIPSGILSCGFFFVAFELESAAQIPSGSSRSSMSTSNFCIPRAAVAVAAGGEETKVSHRKGDSDSDCDAGNRITLDKTDKRNSSVVTMEG